VKISRAWKIFRETFQGLEKPDHSLSNPWNIPDIFVGGASSPALLLN
jgi:hypothetical protein